MLATEKRWRPSSASSTHDLRAMHNTIWPTLMPPKILCKSCLCICGSAVAPYAASRYRHYCW